MTKLRVPAKLFLAFGIVCAALLHAAQAVAAQSDAVGSTESVLRQVRAIQEMDVRELDVGEDVFAKDDVSTGERSAVKITFEDGTAFTMGPDSRVALENIPAVGDEPDSFLLRAARGVFKFVSGALSPEAYRIDTPTATIGVRGTVVPFRVQENLTEVSCLRGQVRACGSVACVTLQPMQYTRIGEDGVPTEPAPIPDAFYDSVRLTWAMLMLDSSGAERVIEELALSGAGPDQIRQRFRDLLGNANQNRSQQQASRPPTLTGPRSALVGFTGGAGGDASEDGSSNGGDGGNGGDTGNIGDSGNDGPGDNGSSGDEDDSGETGNSGDDSDNDGDGQDGSSGGDDDGDGGNGGDTGNGGGDSGDGGSGGNGSSGDGGDSGETGNSGDDSDNDGDGQDGSSGGDDDGDGGNGGDTGNGGGDSGDGGSGGNGSSGSAPAQDIPEPATFSLLLTGFLLLWLLRRETRKDRRQCMTARAKPARRRSGS